MASTYGSVFHYLDVQVFGDDVPLRFSVLNPDGVTAKDLTSATIKWALKTADASTEVLNQDSAGVMVAIESPETGGHFTVTISDTATAVLSEHLYYDEAEVTDGNGLVRTVAHGFIPFRESQV